MGRPRVTELRSEQLNLSFTVTELESIRKRAAALGIRPSHFGRIALLSSKILPRSSSDASQLQRSIHQQLIRLGVNLNQLVRYLNTTGEPIPRDLEPLLADIRALIAKIKP